MREPQNKTETYISQKDYYKTMLKTTLRRSGNSFVVTIPSDIVDLMNFIDGTEFELDFDDNENMCLRKL